MASYIHGTGAEKLAPSEREERLQRKRRQDVGRSVKRQHRIRRNQERAMYMEPAICYHADPGVDLYLIPLR